MSAALKFIGPTEMPAVGHLAFTVRVGTTWDGRVRVGDWVPAIVCNRPHAGDCDEGCDRLGPALIREKWSGPLRNLPHRVVEMEHAHRCRTKGGLYDALTAIYGEAKPNTVVTALGFVLDPRNPHDSKHLAPTPSPEEPKT